MFLSAFIDDIAPTTERDGREHIDYVPAQIVTEYFRRVFRKPDGGRPDRIVYPADHGGTVSIVRIPHDRRKDVSQLRLVPSAVRG